MLRCITRRCRFSRSLPSPPVHSQGARPRYVTDCVVGSVLHVAPNVRQPRHPSRCWLQLPPDLPQRERERERVCPGREGECVCVLKRESVCLCVLRERERERERERWVKVGKGVYVWRVRNHGPYVHMCKQQTAIAPFITSSQF